MKIQYHQHKILRFMIGFTALIAGIFFSVINPKADSIPFGDALTGMFPGIEDNNSSVRFQYGGNNFAGMIFWTNRTILSSPQNVNIIGGTQNISCYKRLNGIYYNNQRGRTIWPLDSGSLQTLRTANPSYNNLTITGGFYTNCIGDNNPGFNNIYGQIDHTLGSTNYHLVAGLNYNTATNTINGNTFTGNLFFTGGVISGFLFDNQGGIGYVGGSGQGCIFGCDYITGGICNNFTGQNFISGGTDATFTCTANDGGGNTVEAYIINIFTYPYGTAYTHYVLTGSNSLTLTTGDNLPEGDYIVTCSILGVGEGAGGQCGPNINLTIGTGSTPIIPPVVTSGCDLIGNIAITEVPGTIVKASEYQPDYYYSRTTGGIAIQLRSSEPSYYNVSSTEMMNNITGYYNYSYNPPYVNSLSTGIIQLTSGEGWKQINTTLSTGSSCTYNAPSKRITLDLLAPTTPSLIYPTNNTGVCYVGNFDLSWSASTDSGVGVKEYIYEIYNNSSLNNPVYIGTTTSTGVTLSTAQIGTYLSGEYYRSVKAVDKLLQSGSVATGSFIIAPQYCTNYNNIFIYGMIPSIRNATVDTNYLSDEFSVSNLPAATLAILNTGTLYINHVSTNSNSGRVNNGDILQIMLKSSSTINVTNSSTISIGPRSSTFYITTTYGQAATGTTTTGAITTGCVLDTGQKLMIASIFDMMGENYSSSKSTQIQFMLTLQSMLQDETDLTNNCSLSYLLDIVDSYVMNTDLLDIDESDHEAPNCKNYSVKYDEDKQGYTSNNLKKKIYFASREALIMYIDSKNPGDCNINTYDNLPSFNSDDLSGSHIAPNGKIYEIKEKIGSGDTTLYYSPDFLSIKYFENPEDLYTYIDKNNPTYDIRDHEVDEDFDPSTFIAPNGKEYRIYKTDRGYMSYRLMKVQYFDTREEIENYITRNNQ